MGEGLGAFGVLDLSRIRCWSAGGVFLFFFFWYLVVGDGIGVMNAQERDRSIAHVPICCRVHRTWWPRGRGPGEGRDFDPFRRVPRLALSQVE
jgi:hypothetical protein